MPNQSRMHKRCAIVGAGASGLACARWALAYDVEPVVFERMGELGGLWLYKSDIVKDVASVMKSTTMNTSKEMSGYSDFPPPKDFAVCMHNREVVAYLKLYAEHHRLVEHIRFKHSVLNVRRADSYPADGKWLVQFEYNSAAGRQKDGTTNMREEVFDCVLVAEGHHAKPNVPDWPGMSSFTGSVIHSHSYKDPHGYDDSTTVVVGIGNSAIDIAVELSRSCRQVYLSTRRGAWILNRVGDGGEPIDMLTSRFNMQYLLRILPRRIIDWVFVQRLQSRFDHKKYGLMPTHRFCSQQPTMSDELPGRIICGSIRIRPDIREFTPTGIIWKDGTVSAHVDNVVLATGYRYDFNIIEHGQLIAPVKGNRSQLYKYVFPIELLDDGHNTLAVIGLLQGDGSLFPKAEMQARFFFEHFAGTMGCLKVSRMKALADIEKMEKANAKRYINSHRYTLQVDYVRYMDELAEMIGCHPKPWSWLFGDPMLTYRLIFKANVPYVYRLRGPKKWGGARQAIMSVDERIENGMKS